MDKNGEEMLGVSVCMDIMDKWEYYIGVEIKEGVYDCTIQPCTWTVFPGKGKMPEAIREIEKRQ